MIYSSPEPTKVCNECGGTFEYKFLVPGKTSQNGVRPLCKPCRSVQQAEERKRRDKKLRELIKLEIAARKAKQDLVPPRTFNHIKDPATWTGHAERQYVRNNGNKHIPSKGTST